jgi:cytoskeletal protein RodZ
MAISVIEESDDGVTDNTMSKIIYKEKKGEGDEKPKKRTKEKVKHKKMKGKELKKKKVNLMLLVISFGSVGLGLLARLALLMAEFGEPVII